MKDAFYFSHDYNSRNDQKILLMRSKYKAEGYGVFWMLVEVMAESTMPHINHEMIPAIAESLNLNPEWLNEFIEFCIEKCRLFVSNGDCFTSMRLIKHKKMRDEFKEFGKKGAIIRWGNDSHPNSPPSGDGNAKERKGKESKQTNPEVLEFLEYFNQKTGKTLSLTDARKKIINDALKFNSINKLKQAVDNFSKDEWPDRRKYMDIIYCIGTIRGINNLDKWATEQPKNAWVKP